MTIRSWRDLVPQRLLSIRPISYQRLPTESRHGLPYTLQPLTKYSFCWSSPRRATDRIRSIRLSRARIIYLAVTLLLLIALLAGGGYKHHAKKNKEPEEIKYYIWQHYNKLNGYFNGIRTLVPFAQYHGENHYNKSVPNQLISRKQASKLAAMPPMEPVLYNPYPAYNSQEYLSRHEKVKLCSLDAAGRVPAPDVYVYPGLPQNMSLPPVGSYNELGLEDKVCFERYGRLGPYGFGYNDSQGGLGPGKFAHSEHAGAEKIFAQTGIINYTNMDWGSAQDRCAEKNKARFGTPVHSDVLSISSTTRVKRHAYVLRIWGGYYFNEHQIYSLRAMINELSLKSGGEYDVHFLLHVKNNSIPLATDAEARQAAIERNMPREFWNLTTTWSESLMEDYYPGPFPDNLENISGQKIHGVYRSAHFALQWFAQQRPEYDFYWNWEMDLRYTGHYYEFNTRLGDWAKQQPRKGLWERSNRFYIPEHHGSWNNFTRIVETETAESGIEPIWGPVQFEHDGIAPSPANITPPRSYADDNYEWGVGEDADLIVFNPLFDPSKTNWVFRRDITGYNLSLPIVPRRTAIITVARLSKRLLDVMHDETRLQHHTMFPEMWPPTVCLHHGLKAVFAPHPVYFAHDWNLEYMDAAFNHPREAWESPFGWGEHNLLGSSFYYNSIFSAQLWRRWLGQKEGRDGGKRFEEEGTGRLCLRSTLHHPIKRENNPSD